MPVTALSGVVVDIAGSGRFTCALTTTNAVWCWGDNTNGQIGRTPPPNLYHDPQLMGGFGGTTPVELAASSGHACARLSNGNVRCWGANLAFQLGTGAMFPIRHTLPQTVMTTGATPVDDALGLALGQAHTCILHDTQRVSCWGVNDLGQSGQIAGGEEHTCVSAGSSVQCWGHNDQGQLGNASTTSSGTPVPVVWP